MKSIRLAYTKTQVRSQHMRAPWYVRELSYWSRTWHIMHVLNTGKYNVYWTWEHGVIVPVTYLYLLPAPVCLSVPLQGDVVPPPVTSRQNEPCESVRTRTSTAWRSMYYRCPLHNVTHHYLHAYHVFDLIQVGIISKAQRSESFSRVEEGES